MLPPLDNVCPSWSAKTGAWKTPQPSFHSNASGAPFAWFAGKKVLLDNDLARLYGVETRALNQAVKRNAERFPEDFMFQLSSDEAETWLRSTFPTVSRFPPAATGLADTVALRLLRPYRILL